MAQLAKRRGDRLLAGRRNQRERVALGRRIGPERCLEVRYESLVAEPEATLRDVCAFASLSYDPKSAGASTNSGQPLPAAAPRSAIVRELRQLTALLVGPAPTAARRRVFALPSLW